MTPELDIEQSDQLLAYLREMGRIGRDEMPAIRVLQGGVSNRTVFVQRANESWVLKQALPKLRVAVDWFSSPERIHREALGLHWLEQLAPQGAVPQFLFEDYAHHVLAMTAVPQPHANWKTLLLAGKLDRAEVEQFGRLLGTIHRRAYEQREQVAPEFADRTFFESLRLEPYYDYTALQAPEAAAFLKSLMAETRATRLTLVHGDYSPKNILIYQGRLILLDHEVIHWGDPAFDLGFSMTHLLSKAHHLPTQRNDFAEAAAHYWQTYCATLREVDWSEALEARAVQHTLGCLLARVAGRSPLEYLNAEERERQQQAVLRVIADVPTRMETMIDDFVAHVERPDRGRMF
jgi:aminoglycoside phosphotransferase (APT) family kinase protein